MDEPNAVEKPRWFTIKQAADYLDVGEPTIYRWMREGRMTYRKVGDSTRFFQEDLDAMVRVFPAEGDVKRVQRICPVCNHDELVDGDVRSTGLVYFHPKKSRFWTLRDSNVAARARMCARCGHITLVGDVDKLNALKAETPPPDSEEDDGEENVS